MWQYNNSSANGYIAHASGYKYLKKTWRNGRWVYEYDKHIGKPSDSKPITGVAPTSGKKQTEQKYTTSFGSYKLTSTKPLTIEDERKIFRKDVPGLIAADTRRVDEARKRYAATKARARDRQSKKTRKRKAKIAYYKVKNSISRSLRPRRKRS